jgi:preprotein translocase subunit SecA
MAGIFSRLFGGNKSEKDVKVILPLVTKINQNFQAYASLSNDALRAKTIEFRQRIQDHYKVLTSRLLIRTPVRRR